MSAFVYSVDGLAFFFFSSRRRHTRFSRDWSSDVCSSDLNSGGRPFPYASNLIKFPAAPLDGGVNHSFHTPSRLNRMLSPGWKLEMPTFSNVRQGVAGESPSLALLPAGST